MTPAELDALSGKCLHFCDHSHVIAAHDMNDERECDRIEDKYERGIIICRECNWENRKQWGVLQ